MSETIPEKMNVALMHEPYDIEIVEKRYAKSRTQRCLNQDDGSRCLWF